jgi:hypothetical protein
MWGREVQALVDSSVAQDPLAAYDLYAGIVIVHDSKTMSAGSASRMQIR